MAPRERLAVLAQRAGYSPGALEKIAHATLPAYTPGERLDDRGVHAVCAAIEVLARGGLCDEQVAVLIDDYRARHGACWRKHWWEARLRIAAWRERNPAAFGPSPTDLPAPLIDEHPAVPAVLAATAPAFPPAPAPAQRRVA